MATILHVEDDKDISNVVKMILEGKGYTVVSVPDAGSALKELESNKPDLILLDVMLPDMSGWELFTKIREGDKEIKMAFLTIIPISSKGMEDLQKYGVSDYITKPFEKKELVDRVEKILSS